jgi:hypothetical protein
MIIGSKHNNLRQRLLDPTYPLHGGKPHDGIPAALQQAVPQCMLPSPEVLSTMTADDAASFAFTTLAQPQLPQPGAAQQQSTTWGSQQAHALLTASGASAEHVTQGWVDNHWRLIVWKLASHDRVRLRSAGGAQVSAATQCDLTPQAVMAQLWYRYTQETAEGRRSVLVKVCHQDKSPQGPMVLLVSGLLNVSPSAEGKGAPARISSVAEMPHGGIGATAATGLALEVSDGWYCVPAAIDGPMAALVAQGRVKVQIRGFSRLDPPLTH